MLFNKIEESNGLTEAIIADNNINKPTAIMEENEFFEAAKTGTLARQGIYVIKNQADRSLKVVTFLDRDNPFDPKKRNYLVHRTVRGFDINTFNNIKAQSFGD